MDSLSGDELRHRPSQMRDLLASLIRRKGFVEQSANQGLDQAWKGVVGPELGRFSKPRKIRAGILEVVVSNSAVLEQLRSYLHQEVLEKMQGTLPDSEIRAIRYLRSR